MLQSSLNSSSNRFLLSNDWIITFTRCPLSRSHVTRCYELERTEQLLTNTHRSVQHNWTTVLEITQCGTVWIKGCRSFIWCFSRFRRLRSLPCQCIQSIIHFELRIVLNRTPKNWKNTTYLHIYAVHLEEVILYKVWSSNLQIPKVQTKVFKLRTRWHKYLPTVEPLRTETGSWSSSEP